ncbi:efflux RND transporter permease subunit [Leucobacter sp. cx-328]|nr:efflux RND transporter permease subunit [Leucobacter sp. cx-328]
MVPRDDAPAGLTWEYCLVSILTRASLKNRLLVGLITLAVAVMGLVSMTSLKQELMPSMQVPAAYVMADSKGLAPEEMSQAVTEPLEQAISAVPGVSKVTSTTSSGSTSISAEWSFKDGDDETLRAIRGAVDAVKPGLPKDANVQVFSGGSDSMPALMLSAGDKAAATGTEEADAAATASAFVDRLNSQVVPALAAVPGVQRVDLSGGQQERIVIDLRPADVAKHKVETAQIQAVLATLGSAAPAGEAQSESGQLSVTVGDKLTSLDQIKGAPLSTEDGVIQLSAIADVKLEAEPITSIARVNGKPSVNLEVYPAQGANVVEISKGVNAELDRLAPTVKAEFVALFDQAPYIEQSIHDLSVEGGLGLLFAILVILAFLGSWRSTIIAAVSIPLSLLITLIGLWVSENTLNILTLAALTIAIGRVVDDSIVVIENISRRRGTGPLTVEGVVASTRQVAGAITASTLTTVAVFLPIALVSGVTGQLFRPFAVTVTIALLASLLVALTIVPVLAYWFMRGSKNRVSVQTAAVTGEGADPSATANEVLSEADEVASETDRLQRAIMPALNATRRRPALTLTASVLILVATFAMLPFVQTDFLGSSGQETLQVTQTPPESGDAAQLIKAAEPVEQALLKVSGVQDVVTSVSLGGSTPGLPTSISYTLMLKEGVDAEKTGEAVEARMQKLKGAGEIRQATNDAFIAGAGGSDISLQISGKDPEALRKASDLLEEKLKESDGVKSVRSELQGEQPVMKVTLDEMKAARLGFDRTSVAAAISNALEGETIGQLMFEGQDRSILLRTPGTARSAEKLGEILLPVTPQQTAEAQKIAAEALQKKAEAEADDARSKAANEISQQISDAADQRSQLNSQLSELNSQLAQLSKAPIMPGKPQTPDEQAAQRAQEERQQQIAALQEAIAGAQGGIAGLDAQIEGLYEAREQAAQAESDAKAAQDEQEAAAKVRGTAIPLSAIATVEEVLTAPSITRAGGERQVTLSVTPKAGGLDAANAAVASAIEKTQLPSGVTFELGGVTAEQDEAFAQLGAAMLAAIALVLVVMIATFRSFRGPMILLVSVPFAATGAILSLLITGTALGLPALIGLLMLIGIVVTNAIVLLDLIGRLREGGESLADAVEHGTRLRLRPILMTAAATIFALIPMSLGLTGGGVFISKPLAIVVIGGLISSTLLTLILVPVLYTLVERRHERKRLRRARKRARGIVEARRVAAYRAGSAGAGAGAGAGDR